MKAVYGAARAALVRRLNHELTTYPEDWSDWDRRHDLIATWHLDDAGHEVCGCEIHQAFCGECLPASAFEYGATS